MFLEFFYSLNAPKSRLLESYVRQESIPLVLERVAKRLRRPFPLQDAYPIVQRDFERLNTEFERFFPRLKQFAAFELNRLQVTE